MIISLIALAVVLILPALRTYHFARSYKPVEAQSAVRHWSLDLNEKGAAKSIDHAAERAPFRGLTPALVPTVALQQAAPATPLVSIARLLKRLRLGSGRAPDLPLLV